MIDINDGDNLLPIDDEDVLVCSECGSTEVATLAFVGLNDHLVDFESFDTSTQSNNYCMDCYAHPSIISRKEFLQKMNDWWDSLAEETRQLIAVSDPFAKAWSTLLYYEKREIYLAHR